MNLLEGTYEGKPLKKQTRILLLEKGLGRPETCLADNLDFGKYNPSFKVPVSKLVSVDVLSEERATGGGVSGAAGGAVLGFMLAGPLGTAIGAGMGSKKKGQDNTTLMLTWESNDVWVVDRVRTKDIVALQIAMKENEKRNKKLQQRSKPNVAKPGKNKRNSDSKSKSDFYPDAYYLEKIGIQKPAEPPKTTPKNGLQLAKGRLASDTASVPSLPALERLKSNSVSEAVRKDTATKLLLELTQREVENYNNWKWRYFNLTIEDDSEVVDIGMHAYKYFASQINQRAAATRLDTRYKRIGKEIKSQQENLRSRESELSKIREEHSHAGFFARRSLEKQLNAKAIEVSRAESDLAPLLKDQATLEKKLKTASIKKDAGLQGFESLDEVFRVEDFVRACGKLSIKSPSKTFKSEVRFDDVFYLKTYRRAFHKIWDEKIHKEVQKAREAHELERKNAVKATSDEKSSSEQPNENQIQPSAVTPKTSKKQQLEELRELLDEGLITQEEYDLARKKTLGLA